MQHVARFIFIPLLAVTTTVGTWAKEGATATARTAEYKRSDTNFYWKGDVLKTYPSATIVAEGSTTRKGDSYVITPHQKAPKEIYVEVLNDWIEPITPPDRPASLGMPPDAMQIREPQGDVRVALPSDPANFVLVTDGMTIPNGAVVKTGSDGTAAVLFGGVDSARLIPNSEAAVQQTVTAQSRSAEVDLTAGGVFSKVGTQVGVKGEYSVHTPFGNAAAHGTDFVTIITSGRTDVWIAQGTVALTQPDGKVVGTVNAEGTGPLKILRFPLITDPHQAMMADADTLTTILNFIPMADQKIKSLRDNLARGTALTANEQTYLKRIKEVPCLIKLALVEPPPPAPAPAPAPVPAVAPAIAAASTPPAPALAPAVPSATATAPTPPSPAKSASLTVVVHPNGTVKFRGATMGLTAFEAKLKATFQSAPDQSFVIEAEPNVPYDKVKAVATCFAAVKIKNVSFDIHASAAPPAVPATTKPAAANPPVPAAIPASVAATTNTPATRPPAPPSPAKPALIRAVVRMDGKINFQGATLTLAEFKSKLEGVMKATPDQAILIKAGKTVPYEKFQAALDICHSAPVKNLTVVAPAPAPPPATTTPAGTATEPATTNLPVPTVHMHPSLEPMSSNAPPETPAGSPAPPTTNAPPPSGP